jgi:hypothetical protein
MDMTLWYLTHNNPIEVPYEYGFQQGDRCPKCGARCQDWSEFIDVGVGSVPVTYHMVCLICDAEGRNSGTDVVWFEPCEESEYGMKELEAGNDGRNN